MICVDVNVLRDHKMMYLPALTKHLLPSVDSSHPVTNEMDKQMQHNLKLIFLIMQSEQKF